MFEWLNICWSLTKIIIKSFIKDGRREVLRLEYTVYVNERLNRRKYTEVKNLGLERSTVADYFIKILNGANDHPNSSC